MIYTWKFLSSACIGCIVIGIVVLSGWLIASGQSDQTHIYIYRTVFPSQGPASGVDVIKVYQKNGKTQSAFSLRTGRVI